MAFGFTYKLELEDGTPADPLTLRTAITEPQVPSKEPLTMVSVVPLVAERDQIGKGGVREVFVDVMDGEAYRGTASPTPLTIPTTPSDCLSEQDMQSLVKCIRLNLDCADICMAAGRVAARQTEYDANVTRTILEACAQACKSCGDECQLHADHHEHCRVCAEACRSCEEACRELLTAMR